MAPLLLGSIQDRVKQLDCGVVAGDAKAEFARNLAIVSDRKAKNSDRAVALCWIFHIVGDMHEPLHAGHRLHWQFPLTDRLGTIAWVRASSQAPPISLHEYRDGAAVDFPGKEAAAAGALSAAIENRHPLPTSVRLTDAPAIAFAGWIETSRKFSADVVFQGSGLASSRDPAAAPLVSPAYQQSARRLAMQRVGQGGLHLADVVKAIFAGHPGPADLD